MEQIKDPSCWISVKLDPGAYMPERAHESDAGYDIRTPYDFRLEPGATRTINSGVHIEIPDGYVGFLKSKSGLNVMWGITGEGVIDAGYTGPITVKLYHDGCSPKIFERGDKIIQLVLLPVFTPELIQVEELGETARGDNGFGSTGR